ncbi:MAG: electron transfer flavoprotein subunit alpha/FixB family protein [Candidatus Adiutrix sp.]|jgi:electron transfer flavoprotein alpha subunit|nr:electron transfer flavoprotein subunit alpha/FixB family protein [Candidatus Adiutrix sp.]
MTGHKNIWVYCELHDGEPAPVVFELLGQARRLAAVTGELAVAVLPGGSEECARILLRRGADLVIWADSKGLGEYKPVPFASMLKDLALRHRPSIFLFGATAQGRDLAPRLQAKLWTGLTSDCLALRIDQNGLLAQTKPSYGDDVMCDIVCPRGRPQMATVRPGVFQPLEEAWRGTDVIREMIEITEDDDYRVIGRKPLTASDKDIAAADFIVALGRGAASEQAVCLAKKLAELVRGVVAVTRPLTEDGRFSQDQLIGQSGKTVKPKCILNFGISGSVQYTAGMSGSRLIISVNKDPDAPVFAISDFGAVSDAEEMLSNLLTALGQA